MIRIRLPDATEATLHARRWHSSDTRVEQLLNAMRIPWAAPTGEDPELKEAHLASKVLGATIIEHESDPAGR